MDNLIERIAILDHRLERLEQVIARLRAAAADTSELERTLGIAAEARVAYLRRLNELETRDAASSMLQR